MGEIKFNNLGGNYGIYQKNDDDNNAKKPVIEDKKASEEKALAHENKSVSPDKVLDTLSFIGMQNFAQVKTKNEITPEDYLTPDNISSIEQMMTENFEKGVEKYAQDIKAEFGSLLSEEAIMALAANAFARAS